MHFTSQQLWAGEIGWLLCLWLFHSSVLGGLGWDICWTFSRDSAAELLLGCCTQGMVQGLFPLTGFSLATPEPFLSISSSGLYPLLSFFYLKQGGMFCTPWKKIPSELGWADGDP